MTVADTILGPWVWGVPARRFTLLNKLSRKIYCRMHADKLRMFYLGMLAGDASMSPKDKEGYQAWLNGVDWAKFLEKVRDVASWKKVADKESNPIDATLLNGINAEYQRLFRCFKDGRFPGQIGVI